MGAQGEEGQECGDEFQFSGVRLPSTTRGHPASHSPASHPHCTLQQKLQRPRALQIIRTVRPGNTVTPGLVLEVGGWRERERFIVRHGLSGLKCLGQICRLDISRSQCYNLEEVTNNSQISRLLTTMACCLLSRYMLVPAALPL